MSNEQCYQPPRDVLAFVYQTRWASKLLIGMIKYFVAALQVMVVQYIEYMEKGHILPVTVAKPAYMDFHILIRNPHFVFRMHYAQANLTQA